MQVKPQSIMDTHAEAIARSLDIVVYSLEGLYEKYARDNPTPQGIREFFALSSGVVRDAQEQSMAKLHQAIDALHASLSDSERDHVALLSSHVNELGEASEAFGAFLTQAKLSFCKRLRDIVLAQAFGTDTYKANPRIMTRTGRTWNFTEYAYLTARAAMVEWYNGAKIAYIAGTGATEFTLLTDDPDLIESTYKVADYPMLAGELFHPRTSKLVGGAHVSS